ncbi:MAG: hypothetical protein HYV29_01710 [Ignavibacteriales bacterium]|nr:hypothetical protein [Ignavibacteriales bacterium]
MTNENILIDKNQETIETWAYVEIMGHQKIAGRVSERKVGVSVMLQIDVPNPTEGYSHSVLYSPQSIFSIQPTTEEWCRKFIAARIEYPVLPYIPASRQLSAPDDEHNNDYPRGDE